MKNNEPIKNIVIKKSWWFFFTLEGNIKVKETMQCYDVIIVTLDCALSIKLF